MKTANKIHCPICKKKNTWHADNTFKPFCSDRCKLIDLGEWASETRKIACESISILENDVEAE